MQAALSNISDVERFTMTSPIADNVADNNKIHALGTITYADY